MRELLNYRLIDSEKFILSVGDVVWILLVLALAILLSAYIRRVILRKSEKQSKTGLGRYYAYSQLVRYLIFIFAVIIILDILGINLTTLKAGSAALLVGLGFGLQHTFNDFISGIIILSEGSLQVGNIIEVQNIVGRVKEIGLRTSKITTRDGVTIIVPNSKMVSENLVNWSHQHVDRTRFNIRFSVGPETDLIQVKEILMMIAENHSDVAKNPGPKVRLFDFTESGYVFDLLFWTSNMFFVETVKSDMRFRIVEQFKKQNIRISFPHRELL